jgi:DNA-binding response OmpR family regulator
VTAHVLIVEDEEGLREGLQRNFEFEGYRVTTAADGQSGLELALATRPDVLILDLMLPRLNGYEVCRRLRGAGLGLPVLMLTVKKEETDRVRGFELGADDYVLKPFSLRELSARVKALLRRAQNQARERQFWKLGDVEVDFARQSATRRGRPVRLSFREFELLRCLASRRGEVVTREELLEQALGYSPSVSSRAVDNLIVHLRKKIEADPRYPRHILTAYGIGYKLVE